MGRGWALGTVINKEPKKESLLSWHLSVGLWRVHKCAEADKRDWAPKAQVSK